MIIWKKSFGLALATSCVAILSFNTQTTSGQVEKDAQASIRIADAMRPDSKPFSRGYRPNLSFRKSPVAAAPVVKENILSNLASHISKASSIAIPKRSVTAKSTSSVDSPQTDVPSNATHSTAPTVVFRPSDVPSSQFNELSVEVNPMEHGEDDEFALKLMIPNSVKVVEFLPADSTNLRRNFKISLGKSTNRDVGTTSTADDVSLNQSSTVHASDLPTPNSASENVFQAGYQKNPFFNAKVLDSNDKTTNFQPNQLPRFRSSVGQSISAPGGKLRSNLASYRTPTTEFSRRTNNKTLTSLIEGKRRMKLGETGDFVVYIFNPGSITAKDVVVKLDVAPGLDVIILDRAAEINKVDGTLAWHLQSVEPGQEHLIRYRVKSRFGGIHRQRISVSNRGNREHAIDADEIETSVISELGD